MIYINKSVGLQVSNYHEDVKKVQILLNQNRHLSGYPAIEDDSVVGSVTITAIKTFQREVTRFSNPDGRVDPNGKTIKALNEGAISGNKPVALPPKSVLPPSNQPSQSLDNIVFKFPLKRRPNRSYKKGGLYFGAPRRRGKNPNRLHAACDLKAPVRTEIFAVANGKISKYKKDWYHEVDAVEVTHTGGFVVRYGEISGLAPGLKIGSEVTAGQLLAYVGLMTGGGHMLHFELYTGKESGALTNRRNKPYERRADLIDPTIYLDNATMP